MAQFIRTKKLTDTGYSPTLAISEPTRRAEVDGSIQEISDILYSTASGKGASQVGLENNPYANVQLLADAIKGASVGFVPLDDSVTVAKLATDTENLIGSKVAKTGDTITGSLTYTKGVADARTSDNLGQYYEANVSLTGTLKITLPSFSGGFFTARILGYDYGAGIDNTNAWELTISGNLDSSPAWFGVSAILTGKANFASVRLGVEAGKPVILLGTLSTTWSYPTVSIMEMVNSGSQLGTTWTIARVTSEAGITITKTPVVQGTTATTTITSGFAAGWSDVIVVRKGLNNLCQITINLTKTSDVTASEVVYTLPVGLRPIEVTLIDISLFDTAGSSLASNRSYLLINTNGEITVAPYPTTTTTNARRIIYRNVTYISA